MKEDSCIIKVKVKLNSRKFMIARENSEQFTVFVTERPEENKVNKEIIKELTKMFKKPVYMLSGQKSRIKRLKIEASAKEVEDALKEQTKLNV